MNCVASLRTPAQKLSLSRLLRCTPHFRRGSISTDISCPRQVRAFPDGAQIAAPQHLSLWAKPATLKGASERNQAIKRTFSTCDLPLRAGDATFCSQAFGEFP